MVVTTIIFLWLMLLMLLWLLLWLSLFYCCLNAICLNSSHFPQVTNLLIYSWTAFSLGKTIRQPVSSSLENSRRQHSMPPHSQVCFKIIPALWLTRRTKPRYYNKRLNDGGEVSSALRFLLPATRRLGFKYWFFRALNVHVTFFPTKLTSSFWGRWNEYQLLLFSNLRQIIFAFRGSQSL